MIQHFMHKVTICEVDPCLSKHILVGHVSLLVNWMPENRQSSVTCFNSHLCRRTHSSTLVLSNSWTRNSFLSQSSTVFDSCKSDSPSAAVMIVKKIHLSPSSGHQYSSIFQLLNPVIQDWCGWMRSFLFHAKQ